MATFEVRFRGEDEPQLLAWKPGEADSFECKHTDAHLRFEALVRSGIDGLAVDGVVPYVVALVSVSHKRRDNQEVRLSETVAWRYCEVEEPDFEPSGVAVGESSH